MLAHRPEVFLGQRTDKSCRVLPHYKTRTVQRNDSVVMTSLSICFARTPLPRVTVWWRGERSWPSIMSRSCRFSNTGPWWFGSHYTFSLGLFILFGDVFVHPLNEDKNDVTRLKIRLSWHSFIKITLNYTNELINTLWVQSMGHVI